MLLCVNSLSARAQRFLIAVGLIACTAVSSVRAQPARSPTPSEQQALLHYRRGEALFRAKKYQAAIREFERAYASAPFPEFVLNLAQAHRAAGNLQVARDYYQRFLKTAAGHAMAPEVAVALTQIEETLKQQRERAKQDRQRAAERRAAAARRAKTRGQTARIAGLVAIGGAVIGLGVSSVFAYQARSVENEIDANKGQWTDELIDKFEEGNRLKRRARWAGGISALLLVGGGVSYLLSRRVRNRALQRVEVALGVSRTQGHALVTGRF